MKLYSADQLKKMGLDSKVLAVLLQNSSHITGNQIAHGAIDTLSLRSLSVTNAKINDVTANKITTGTLQASVSVTIGGTFNTGTAGAANVKIDPTGIRGYDATNTQRFALLTTGAGWLGNSTDFSWTAAGAVHITSAAIDSLSVTKLTTGNLTAIGTITTGSLVTAASPNARIEITSTLIAGYSDATTKQFYLQATDGKAYAGAGAVTLDSSGVHITGSALTVDAPAGTIIGTIGNGTLETVAAMQVVGYNLMYLASTSGDVLISSAANKRVRLAPGSGSYIDATTNTIKNVVDPTDNQDAATKKYVDDNTTPGFTTQSVVTGSRALDTVYQNTGSTPKLVTVSVALQVQDLISDVDGSSYVTVYTDSSNPPTTGVGALDNDVASGTTGDFLVYYSITFVVLPSNYYKVTKGKAGDGLDADLQYWTEWS